MTRALLSCKAAKTAAAVNALRSARIPFSGGRRRGGEFLFRVPAGSADRALKALKERGIDCVVLALGGRARLKAALFSNLYEIFKFILYDDHIRNHLLDDGKETSEKLFWR